MKQNKTNTFSKRRRFVPTSEKAKPFFLFLAMTSWLGPQAEGSSIIDGPAIHAHPDDPAASARAFRQAIDAATEGIKASD